MLMPLMRSNDLPLKLGDKVPTAAEKAKNIAQMEARAKALDVDLSVAWVPDDRTPLSDFDHPAAEMDDPMAVVASEYEKMLDGWSLKPGKLWFAVDPGRVGGDETAAVKYWVDADSNIHAEPINSRKMYEESAPLEIRDIPMATRDGYQDRLNREMTAMAERRSCVPPGTITRLALKAEADAISLRQELTGITDVMRGAQDSDFTHRMLFTPTDAPTSEEVSAYNRLLSVGRVSEAERTHFATRMAVGQKPVCPDCGASEGSSHHEKCNVRARALTAFVTDGEPIPLGGVQQARPEWMR